jgi:hypothetical protein
MRAMRSLVVVIALLAIACADEDLAALPARTPVVGLGSFVEAETDAGWMRGFGTCSTHPVAPPFAVGPSSELVVAVPFDGSCTFDTGSEVLDTRGDMSIALAKFDAAGQPLWSRTFEGSERYTHVPGAVAIDNDGNVVLAGWFTGKLPLGGEPLRTERAGDRDIFVAKFDAEGNPLWSTRYGPGHGWQFPDAVAVDNAGNIVMAGSFEESVDFGLGGLVSEGERDVFVVKIRADGAPVWSRRFGGIGEDFGRTVSIDPTSGDIVVGADLDYSGATTGDDEAAWRSHALIVRLSSDGEELWRSRFGDDEWLISVGDVAFGLDGSVIATGGYVGLADFGGTPLPSVGSLSDQGANTDLFVLALGADGTHAWSQRFGDERRQFGTGLAVDGPGTITVVAEATVGVDGFESAPVVGDARGTLVALFEAGGTQIRARLHLGATRLGDIEVDGEGRAWAIGRLGQAIDFGFGPLTPRPRAKSDVFLANFAP